MAIQFQIIKNDVLSALILSVITVIVTMINIPKNKYIDENDNRIQINRAWIAIKSFLMACVGFYVLIYFFSSDPSSSLISNMKQGEPSF